jgi:hypothetical protein
VAVEKHPLLKKPPPRRGSKCPPKSRTSTNLRRRWEGLGFKWELKWREILEVLAVMAVILVAYFALPSRYHLNPDWQEAAVSDAHVGWDCLYCTVMAEHRLPDFTGNLFRHPSLRCPCLDTAEFRPQQRSGQGSHLSRLCAVPCHLWGCSAIEKQLDHSGSSKITGLESTEPRA